MTLLDASPDVLPGGTSRPAYDNDPLPAWVAELRAHQVDAVREVVEQFADGADVVFLDAPVGAGKTLIGELVRRELHVDQALYICSDKSLQDQFVRDFPYAKLLKGRGNYPTSGGASGVTAEDCTFEGGGEEMSGVAGACMWCDPVAACPYRRAKQAALSAKVAVLNTSYFLHAQNFTNMFRDVGLVIADEADMLEDALIGFSEYEVPWQIGKTLGLDYPIKGAHKPTLVKWLDATATTANAYLAANRDSMEVKARSKLGQFRAETRMVAKQLQRDIDAAQRDEDDDSDSADAGRWIREYDGTRTFKMLPVTASPYGSKHLWRHGAKWLLMSGTIISADEMADSLGLALDYASVSIGSPFPVENRRIVLAPVANVTAKATPSDYEDLAYAIDRIIEKHPGRVLVHAVSYRLAQELMTRVEAKGRVKVSYAASREKQGALDRYLRTPGAVMIAASMSRGVDLAGEACECQIVAKCPFPSLGDKRVAARMHTPGGQQWYATKTVRDVVQMTGRGVRSESDVCPTYVLDMQFTKNVWAKSKGLFPAYFRDAVDARSDVRWLLRGAR